MTDLTGDESYPDSPCPEHGHHCVGETCCCRDKHRPAKPLRDPAGPWVISELSLNLPGPPPEGQPHPESTPIGPFLTRFEADAWADAETRKYGGGSWSVAPLRAPESGPNSGPLLSGTAPHEFEAFDGASGMVCTAMVLRDGAGEDCGLPGDHSVHNAWVRAHLSIRPTHTIQVTSGYHWCLECGSSEEAAWAFGAKSAAYLIAATSWPWEQEEARLSWSPRLIQEQGMRFVEYSRALQNLQRAYAYLESGGA